MQGVTTALPHSSPSGSCNEFLKFPHWGVATPSLLRWPGSVSAPLRPAAPPQASTSGRAPARAVAEAQTPGAAEDAVTVTLPRHAMASAFRRNSAMSGMAAYSSSNSSSRPCVARSSSSDDDEEEDGVSQSHWAAFISSSK